MNEEGVREFLDNLGVEQVADSPSSKGWLASTCPFAKHTHAGGTDSKPSFGILVDDLGPSAYNCLSCGEKGLGLQGVAWRLRSLGDSPPSEISRIVREKEIFKPKRHNDSLGGMLRRRRERTKAIEEYLEEHGVGELGETFDIPRPKIPEDSLDGFIKAHHPYMANRGFTKAACKAWGLSIDHKDYGDRIVFPIRDIDGNLMAFSRRVTWDKAQCQWCGYCGPDQKFGIKPNKEGEGGCPKCGKFVWPKYMHSKGFQRNLYLYGEHMIDRSHRKGVIVEGNLDPIRLWQLGVKNAVATLGSNPGEQRPDPVKKIPGQQLYRIELLFDEILILADGDQAGRQWANTIERHFKNRWISTHVKICPDGKDPGDTDEKKLRDLIGSFSVWR
jgi:5S rRNA maturation endonuclease (ribonuclease M5)